MPEVIDLLSSSPPPSRPAAASQEYRNLVARPLSQSESSSHKIRARGSNLKTDDDALIEEMLANPVIANKIRKHLSPRNSSSPAKPTSSMPHVAFQSSKTLRDRSQFDDSLLDNLDDNEWLNKQPAKRRRLSPIAPRSGTTRPTLNTSNIHDLSSEPDTETHSKSKRTSDLHVYDLDDDIDAAPFNSSAPAPPTIVALSQHDAVETLSDDENWFLNDPIKSSSQPALTSRLSVAPSKTASVLSSLKQPKAQKFGTARSSTDGSMASLSNYGKVTKPRSLLKGRLENFDNIVDLSQPGTSDQLSKRPQKPSIGTDKSAAPPKPRKTSAEKEADKEDKRLAREAEKERKRLEKEQKAVEKQRAADVAEVNKKKTDKKESAKEMIIDLPVALRGKSLANQLEEMMKENEVKVSYYHNEIDTNMTSDDSTGNISMGNIIKWRREVRSTYNDATEQWDTCDLQIKKEKHILVHLSAEEFFIMAVLGPFGRGAENSAAPTSPTEVEMKENLDTCITLLRSRHAGCTIVLLIQGLTSFLKKTANAKNRDYAAAVRAAQDAPSSSQPPTSTQRQPKKRKAAPPVDLSLFTQDHIDTLTLHLQLHHQPLQLHQLASAATNHPSSIASITHQITNFTLHLSTRPYRLQQSAYNLRHASFCMDAGQFKTGQGDVLDTWIKMLEVINRVTPSMARGIVAAGYESPAELVKGFEKEELKHTGGGRSIGGETAIKREAKRKAAVMLEHITRSTVASGGGDGGKRLGPKVSQRLYRVFMGRDEGARDGIA